MSSEVNDNTKTVFAMANFIAHWLLLGNQSLMLWVASNILGYSPPYMHAVGMVVAIRIIGARMPVDGEPKDTPFTTLSDLTARHLVLASIWLAVILPMWLLS
jgi:hypothetical protein